MALNDLVIALRPQLEPLSASAARARWQCVRDGLPAAPGPLGASPFAREASFHALREAREGASERASARLRRLQALASQALSERLGAEAEAERFRIERESRLEAGLGGHSLPVARWSARRSPDRAKRDALETGIARLEAALASPAQRRFEAAFQAAEVLGLRDPQALQDEVTGIVHGDWALEAARFEDGTREGFLDLLRFALERSVPGLRPLPRGDAALHDVLYASRIPWMEPLLPRESLLPALQRWTDELFDGWTAQGRIRIHLDVGPPHAPPEAVGLSIPGEIHLAVRREAGVEGWRALLGAVGEAQALSMMDPHAPPEDRWLGDGAVRALPGLLVQTLLLEPRWLMRYLRLTANQAREVVRFSAFSALTETRERIARFDLERIGFKGLTREQLERFWSERVAQALHGRVSGSRAFSLLHPGLASVDPLRGWALVGALHPRLLASFDEDWWRNPAAGHFLRGIFSRGGRDQAELLATEWGGATLTLEAWQTRLLRCMSA